ncbi:hypothetical protein C7959_1751 [Orenia marismortui]|uniref:Rubredoxin n=2 Tax=Orenia marismortui TaxID=46469 RepID=A0A4R8GFD6_9FIRM|nr:hypothetical protein C7959_1751 [Orenia marismortui]
MEKEKWYKYKCNSCNFEDEIPEFILDELFVLSKLEGVEGDGTNCPECGFKMKPQGFIYR